MAAEDWSNFACGYCYEERARHVALGRRAKDPVPVLCGNGAHKPGKPLRADEVERMAQLRSTGLSQETVASWVGVVRETVANYERRDFAPIEHKTLAQRLREKRERENHYAAD